MGVTAENDASRDRSNGARNHHVLLEILNLSRLMLAHVFQNCCESPAAKKLALEVLSARDQALVLNPHELACRTR